MADEIFPEPPPRTAITSIALGAVGAIAGAIVGGAIFQWVLGQGFYMLALPGALIGLGAGYLSRTRSLALAIFSAVLAAIAGIYLEWKTAPFIADGSLSYFVTHLHKLTPVTQIMWAIGVLFGFWFGRGRG